MTAKYYTITARFVSNCIPRSFPEIAEEFKDIFELGYRVMDAEYIPCLELHEVTSVEES